MGVADEVLREKGESKKKKKEEEGELWNILEFGGMVGKKKEEIRGKKKKKKTTKKINPLQIRIPQNTKQKNIRI